MKKMICLGIAAMVIAACSFRGFKPAPDSSAGWKLNKYYDDTKSLYEYVVKRDNDFRACGLDPVSGGFTGSREHPELSSVAGGYLCLENIGWYNSKGPTCLVEWLFFKTPECVAWREARGLSNAPKPADPYGSTDY